MGIVWRVVSFISVWLLYGLIASLFVKNVKEVIRLIASFCPPHQQSRFGLLIRINDPVIDFGQ